METTANYELKKPAANDFYNIEDFNDNADIIDGKLKDHEDQLSKKAPSDHKHSAADVGAVAADGSVPMTNDLYISKTVTPNIYLKITEQGYSALCKNANTTVDYGTQMIDVDVDGNNATLQLRGSQYDDPANALYLRLRNADQSISNLYQILHTGNKNLITAADIGAIPAITVYYSAGMSADDLAVPLALIPVSTSLNAELQNITLGSYAYVLTFFYASVSTTSRRMQLGFSYNSPVPKMAFRIYSANGWTTWREFAYADYALARDGSNTMTGDLKIYKNSAAVVLNVDESGNKCEFRKNASSGGADYGSYIRDWSNDGRYAFLKMTAVSQAVKCGFLDAADGTAKEYTLLHTGNKSLISPEDIGAAATVTYSATVTAVWTASGDYFYQSITVNGILAADNPIVDIKAGSDNAANAVYSENMCKVFRITTAANSITVWATEAINTAFPIQLKVVR